MERKRLIETVDLSVYNDNVYNSPVSIGFI